MGKLKSMLFLVVLPLVLVSSNWVVFEDYLELAPPKLLPLFGNHYLQKKPAPTVAPPAVTVPVGAPPTKFDYFMFSQAWAPSVWNIKPAKPPQEFKIHGLWPQDYKRTDLDNGCKGRPTYEKITDKKLIARLDVSWPNLDKPDNNAFWEAEYNKHGTCAFGYTQPEYFDEALKLKENRFNDLLTYLKNNAKGPGRSYKTKEFVSTIKEYTKIKDSLGNKEKDPDLLCIVNGKRLVLVEIRICLDKTLKVIDCPSGRKDTSCYKGAATIEFP